MSEVTVIQGNFSPEYLDWRRLRSALETSGGDPFGVFVRLDQLLEDQAWSRLEGKDGELFRTFESFVKDDEKGLGMKRDELDKLLAVVGDTEKKQQHGDLFDRVRERVSRAWKEEIAPANKQGRPTENNVARSLSHNDTGDGILARLKRDDPDLAAQVVNGELTANQAAMSKGWRKPRIVLTSPESIARKLHEHLSPDDVAALKELL